ncbi:hypothetical protein FT159_03445 [Bordetella pertussis]
MTQKTKLPVWYLPGPFYRYEQDVKAEAAKAGVRIVDANATGSRDGAAKEVPKVTLKPEYRSKGKAEAPRKRNPTRSPKIRPRPDRRLTVAPAHAGVSVSLRRYPNAPDRRRRNRPAERG